MTLWRKFSFYGIRYFFDPAGEGRNSYFVTRVQLRVFLPAVNFFWPELEARVKTNETRAEKPPEIAKPE